MPQVHCPHCGQAFDTTDEPIPMMAYATPTYERPRQAKWVIIACISLAASGLLLGVFFLALLRPSQIQTAATPATFTAQLQQSQQFLRTQQTQQVAQSQRMQQSIKQSLATTSRLTCAGNMMQIGFALQQYASHNAGQFPARLEDLALTHYITRDVLVCHGKNMSATFGNPFGLAATQAAGEDGQYIYVPNLGASASADTIVLYEPLSNHGGTGMNVLYHNSHVAFLETTSASGVIAELNAGFNPPRSGHY